MNESVSGLKTGSDHWQFSKLEYFFNPGNTPDPKSIRGTHGAIDLVIDEVSAIKIAEKYGLNVQSINGNWMILCNRDYPSIAKQNDGRYVLILRADSEKFLIHDPAHARTAIVPTHRFLSDWSGLAIVFVKNSTKKD